MPVYCAYPSGSLESQPERASKDKEGFSSTIRQRQKLPSRPTRTARAGLSQPGERPPGACMQVVRFDEVMAAREALFWHLVFEHLLLGAGDTATTAAIFHRLVSNTAGALCSSLYLMARQRRGPPPPPIPGPTPPFPHWARNVVPQGLHLRISLLQAKH